MSSIRDKLGLVKTEIPIDEINLIEKETFQYKQRLSEIDSKFLLNFKH